MQQKLILLTGLSLMAICGCGGRDSEIQELKTGQIELVDQVVALTESQVNQNNRLDIHQGRLDSHFDQISTLINENEEQQKAIDRHDQVITVTGLDVLAEEYRKASDADKWKHKVLSREVLAEIEKKTQKKLDDDGYVKGPVVRPEGLKKAEDRLREQALRDLQSKLSRFKVYEKEQVVTSGRWQQRIQDLHFAGAKVRAPEWYRWIEQADHTLLFQGYFWHRTEYNAQECGQWENVDWRGEYIVFPAVPHYLPEVSAPDFPKPSILDWPTGTIIRPPSPPQLPTAPPMPRQLQPSIPSGAPVASNSYNRSKGHIASENPLYESVRPMLHSTAAGRPGYTPAPLTAQSSGTYLNFSQRRWSWGKR